MANRPFGPTGVRVFFSALSPVPDVGDTAGFDLQVGGSGLLLFRLEMLTGDEIRLRLSDATLLDADLVTVTPTIISDPNAVLTSVIRVGSVTDTLDEPDFIFRANVNGDVLRGHEIFVPPGKFLTVLRDTIDEAMEISAAFTEL